MALLDKIFQGYTETASLQDIVESSICLLTKVKMDSGANILLKKNLSLLNIFWDIMAYRISGIGSGVMFTKLELFHLECPDGSVIPALMYFLSKPLRPLSVLGTSPQVAITALTCGGNQ